MEKGGKEAIRLDVLLLGVVGGKIGVVCGRGEEVQRGREGKTRGRRTEFDVGTPVALVVADLDDLDAALLLLTGLELGGKGFVCRQQKQEPGKKEKENEEGRTRRAEREAKEGQYSARQRKVGRTPSVALPSLFRVEVEGLALTFGGESGFDGRLLLLLLAGSGLARGLLAACALLRLALALRHAVLLCGSCEGKGKERGKEGEMVKGGRERGEGDDAGGRSTPVQGTRRPSKVEGCEKGKEVRRKEKAGNFENERKRIVRRSDCTWKSLSSVPLAREKRGRKGGQFAAFALARGGPAKLMSNVSATDENGEREAYLREEPRRGELGLDGGAAEGAKEQERKRR